MSLTYMLREGPAGAVEIVEFASRVLAVCPRREDADRLLILLQAGGDGRDAPAWRSSAAAAVVSLDAATTTLGAATISPADAVTPVPDQAEPDWPAMFTLLEEGEPLTAVASKHKVPMTSLRARWAARPRPGEGGQVNCSQCDRPFKPSLANPDKCARCSRD